MSKRLESLRSRIADLEERQAQAKARLVTLAEEAETRGADLEGADAEEYRSLEVIVLEEIPAELDPLREQAERLQRVLDTPEPSTEKPAAVYRTANHRANPLSFGREFGAPDEVRAAACEAVERGVVELDDRYRDNAYRLLRTIDRPEALARHVISTGRPAYRSAFQKLIGGKDYALTDEERQALDHARAASLTGSAGGFAIPFTLDPTVVLTGAHDGEGNVWRQISRVVQITTDQWNGVTSAGITASWDGEAGEVSDDAPTLVQPSIDVHKAQAFVPFSIEVGQDWASMESDIRELFMVAKDDLEASAFAAAAAPSNSPQGLINALDGTASELTPAVAETFALVDVDKTFNQLPRRHRSRASWLADVSTYTEIRRLLRTQNTGGSDEWVQLSAGEPAMAYGRPAYEEPNLRGFSDVNAAATADNFILVFGDFSRYVIVDRVGMNVELVPHLFATGNNRPSGQRGLYMWWRVGAEPIDTNAFRVLNIATTA